MNYKQVLDLLYRANIINTKDIAHKSNHHSGGYTNHVFLTLVCGTSLWMFFESPGQDVYLVNVDKKSKHGTTRDAYDIRDFKLMEFNIILEHILK